MRDARASSPCMYHDIAVLLHAQYIARLFNPRAIDFNDGGGTLIDYRYFSAGLCVCFQFKLRLPNT